MTLRAIAALMIPAVYWLFVLANIREVRRRTGRAPSLAPSRPEEKPLRLGWHLIIAGWFFQPLWLIFSDASAWLLRPMATLGTTYVTWSGVVLGVFGLCLTKWCHRAMGEEWKMWIDAAAQPRLVESGPFRWVRHPIYSSQAMALLGTWLLTPSVFLAAIVGLHVYCIRRKATIEENHMRDAFGEVYDRYRERTGRFIPRFWPKT